MPERLYSDNQDEGYNGFKFISQEFSFTCWCQISGNLFQTKALKQGYVTYNACVKQYEGQAHTLLFNCLQPGCSELQYSYGIVVTHYCAPLASLPKNWMSLPD